MAGLTTFAELCSLDCAPHIYPALSVDQNCNGIPNISELTDLWIKPNGAAIAEIPFSNWGTTTDTQITFNAIAVDNTVIDNSKVKWLTGVGNIAAPEKVTLAGVKGSEFILHRTYTVSYTITNLSDLQYDFLVSLQCNPLDFTYWYANEAHVFGKEMGISPLSVDVDFIYAEGQTSVESATLVLKFRSKRDPERRNNPTA